MLVLSITGDAWFSRFYGQQHSSAAPTPSCLQGLTYTDTAYKETNVEPGHEAKVTAMPPFLVTFPRNFSLDKSYRMRGGRWAGGSAGAVANDGNVPKGLYVMGSGSEGGAKGWSIGAPPEIAKTRVANTGVLTSLLRIINIGH